MTVECWQQRVGLTQAIRTDEMGLVRRSPTRRRFPAPLTREEVLTAEKLWGGPDRLAWESQWQAIDTIANDLWSTPTGEADRARRLLVLLTYAVGNFKRQGNTVILPLPSRWALTPLPGRQSHEQFSTFLLIGRTSVRSSSVSDRPRSTAPQLPRRPPTDK